MDLLRCPAKKASDLGSDFFWVTTGSAQSDRQFASAHRTNSGVRLRFCSMVSVTSSFPDSNLAEKNVKTIVLSHLQITYAFLLRRRRLRDPFLPDVDFDFRRLRAPPSCDFDLRRRLRDLLFFFLLPDLERRRRRAPPSCDFDLRRLRLLPLLLLLRRFLPEDFDFERLFLPPDIGATVPPVKLQGIYQDETLYSRFKKVAEKN